MRTIAIFFVFSVVAAAQSFHVIRVIPTGAGAGEIDFCGDSSHTTTCVTAKASTAGTTLAITGNQTISGTLGVTGAATLSSTLGVVGNSSLGTGDNAYLTVDASGNARLGITKKSGSNPKITHGNATDLCFSFSSAADIGSANTFTDDACFTSVAGTRELVLSDILYSSFSSANALIYASNSGAGYALQGSGAGNAIFGYSTGGVGVTGTGATYGVIGTGGGSGAGVEGIGTGSNAGVLGTHTNLDGVSGQVSTGQAIHGYASSSGYGGYFQSTTGTGIYALSTGGGLAANFTYGNVQIDNGSLIVNGTSSLNNVATVTAAAGVAGQLQVASTSSGGNCIGMYSTIASVVTQEAAFCAGSTNAFTVTNNAGSAILVTTQAGKMTLADKLVATYTQVTPVTVAALPACGAGTKGAMHGVTDALAPAYLVAVVGGGAVGAPVYCDGTNWVSF